MPLVTLCLLLVKFRTISSEMEEEKERVKIDVEMKEGGESDCNNTEKNGNATTASGSLRG